MAREHLHGSISQGDFAMKFSVLLPTRNRLEYLKCAVETVRRQDYENWEIIISDNCSEDDIGGYVGSLADARIKYLRREALVPVTDNWNYALLHSNGDYVVMLGDDDGLVPGYFLTVMRALETYGEADFVYVGGYYFAYAGVLPDEPAGFLRRDRNRVFTEDSPCWLDAQRAQRIARRYTQFRMPVASNMQFSLISRRKLSELTRNGRFFQSPFPDFYATPALFLLSNRILVLPQPLVIIGITPKSYGSFHFNGLHAEGAKFLENDSSLSNASGLQSVMLPGTSYYDSWLLAMEALCVGVGKSCGLRPNYRRYRFLQIVHGYKKCYMDSRIAPADLASLRAQMRIWERVIYGTVLRLGIGVIRLIPSGGRARSIAFLRRYIGQHALSKESRAINRLSNVLDVYESLDTESISI